MSTFTDEDGTAGASHKDVGGANGFSCLQLYITVSSFVSHWSYVWFILTGFIILAHATVTLLIHAFFFYLASYEWLGQKLRQLALVMTQSCPG